MKSFKYAIGDIHGRLDVLLKSIELIEQHRSANSAKATVVFLGDYVDRGPNSKEVCDVLMAGPSTPNTEWVCLQGNHEVIMIEAGMGGYSEQKFWHNNGGIETLNSFGGYREMIKYIDWMKELPKYYYDGDRVFVHAGVQPGTPLEQTSEAVLQWIRYKDDFEINSPLGYVVHGHTPKMGEPLILETRCDLDVYAVATGKVCVAVFEDGVKGKPISLLETNLGYRAIDT